MISRPTTAELDTLDRILRRAVLALRDVADDRTRRPESREIRLKNLYFYIEKLIDEMHELIDR